MHGRAKGPPAPAEPSIGPATMGKCGKGECSAPASPQRLRRGAPPVARPGRRAAGACWAPGARMQAARSPLQQRADGMRAAQHPPCLPRSLWRLIARCTAPLLQVLGASASATPSRTPCAGGAAVAPSTSRRAPAALAATPPPRSGSVSDGGASGSGASCLPLAATAAAPSHCLAA